MSPSRASLLCAVICCCTLLNDSGADASKLSKLFRFGMKKATQQPPLERQQQQNQSTALKGQQQVSQTQLQSQQKSTQNGANNRRKATYIKQATEAAEVAWQFMSSKDGWSKEADGSGTRQGTVYSKTNKKYGKMFKLEATLDVDADLVYNDLIANAAKMPSWNPTLLLVKIIEILDNQTAVVYNVAAPAAGGLVSSRDFVFLTRHLTRDGWRSSCIVSTTHSATPESSSYVRGEQAPGCMRFKSAGQGRSSIEWMLNTNLKGWLTQYVVDSAMSGAMMNYVEYLRRHCNDLKSSALANVAKDGF